MQGPKGLTAGAAGWDGVRTAAMCAYRTACSCAVCSPRAQHAWSQQHGTLGMPVAPDGRVMSDQLLAWD